MELVEYLKNNKFQFTENNGQISVGGYLDLHEEIQNVAFKKRCGRKNRTIFAAWVNGEMRIGAGCFLGPIHRFNDAVDENYSGAAATKYKDDANDCVTRLVKILGMEAV